MTKLEHPDGLALQAYHDGELEAPAAAVVADHCAKCAVCRAELDELSSVGRLLAEAPAPALRRPVWPRVRPGRAQESRLRPVLGLAACAAGIVAGVLLGPIRFQTEDVDSDVTWTGSMAVWSGNATSPLLAVYQSEQE